MSVPYCIQCNAEMICTKTGYILTPVGRVDDLVYNTDLFRCVYCGALAHNELVRPQQPRTNRIP